MLVGLTGKAGAGKDTVADILVRDHGFVKLAFADPLKRICKDVYQFTDEQLWGPSQMRNAPDVRYPLPSGGGHLSPRIALQTLGTEWGRFCYADTWLDYTMRVVDWLRSKPVPGTARMYDARRGLTVLQVSVTHPATTRIVLSDVRFDNEAVHIRARGGAVWGLRRAGLSSDIGVQNHISEKNDVITDAVIENSGTLEELAAQVANLITITRAASVK